MLGRLRSQHQDAEGERAQYQRTPRAVAAIHGVSTVVTDGVRFFTLNESGSRIWQLLEAPRTSSEIADTIAREFDAPLDTVEHDTEQLFRELLRLKLITCTNA